MSGLTRRASDPSPDILDIYLRSNKHVLGGEALPLLLEMEDEVVAA